MTDQERIQSLRDFIRFKERSIKRAEKAFSSGVRSSSASADIAIDRSALARAALELSELEGKQ